jgi:hypothetical protein
MANKTREQIKRSRAAVKGWQTRRKNNPEKWGAKRVSSISKPAKKLRERGKQKTKKQLEIENKRLKAQLAKAHAKTKKITPEVVKKKKKRKRKSLKRFMTPEQAIRKAQRMGLDVEKLYMDFALAFGMRPGEIYTLWLSPDAA